MFTKPFEGIVLMPRNIVPARGYVTKVTRSSAGLDDAVKYLHSFITNLGDEFPADYHISFLRDEDERYVSIFGFDVNKKDWNKKPKRKHWYFRGSKYIEVPELGPPEHKEENKWFLRKEEESRIKKPNIKEYMAVTPTEIVNTHKMPKFIYTQLEEEKERFSRLNLRGGNFVERI